VQQLTARRRAGLFGVAVWLRLVVWIVNGVFLGQHALMQDADGDNLRAAMLLLASEMVGPYPDRVATFLGYPVSLVQVIATRLTEARIWEGYEIHCERWYDPQHGRVSFIIDVMIATGHIIRVWMEEKNQHGYPFGRHLEASQFAI